MRVKAHFFLVNEDFSPEFADANYDGEESENNLRYYWEDALEIKGECSDIEELKQSEYVLQGMIGEGEHFSFSIPNMRQLLVKGEDGSVTPLAFSENIFHEFTVDEEEGVHIIRVYFKDYEVFSNPIPGVYITAADFPEELAR